MAGVVHFWNEMDMPYTTFSLLASQLPRETSRSYWRVVKISSLKTTHPLVLVLDLLNLCPNVFASSPGAYLAAPRSFGSREYYAEDISKMIESTMILSIQGCHYCQLQAISFSTIIICYTRVFFGNYLNLFVYQVLKFLDPLLLIPRPFYLILESISLLITE